MRRKEREIRDKNEVERVLAEADVLFLAMNDSNVPYIVPVNFAHRGGAIYIHSAVEGKKIKLIEKDPRISFCCVIGVEIAPPDDPAVACGFSTKYRSVVGCGVARIVTDSAERERALAVLVEKYKKSPPPEGGFKFNERALAIMAVIKIKVEEMWGKGN